MPCGRVPIAGALQHPQVAPREILLARQHPEIGTIETLAPVVRLAHAGGRLAPPPALGEHTREVLDSLPSRVS